MQEGRAGQNLPEAGWSARLKRALESASVGVGTYDSLCASPLAGRLDPMAGSTAVSARSGALSMQAAGADALADLD